VDDAFVVVVVVALVMMCWFAAANVADMDVAEALGVDAFEVAPLPALLVVAGAAADAEEEEEDDEEDDGGTADVVVPFRCSNDEPFEPGNWGLMETGDTSADESTRAATAAA
jgi:hypothetical protein